MKQIAQAAEVMKRAYAPYSKFQVGCVVVTAGGKQYAGCNVENACYPAGICAERSAISQAVADGSQDIKEVYLVASADRPCFPCGICLQVMSEFNKDMVIISASQDQQIITKFKLTDLLPHIYDRSFLTATV